MEAMWQKVYESLVRVRFVRILLQAAMRFHRDLCFTRAASLSYTTLVSLVPAFTLGALFLSNFKFGQDLLKKMEAFLYKHALPESTQLIQTYMTQFTANTTAVNVVGFASLVVTALLLVHSVEQTLNDIWRSHEQRPIFKKISFFWSVLTLTPICLALSIYYTSFYTARIEEMDIPFLKNLFLTLWLQLVVPVGFAAAAFFTLYYLIPYNQISALSCMLGSVVAALLWEGAKQMFDNYLVNVASYNLIYGSIGIFLLFLLWLYFTWTIILFGAQVAVVNQFREDESSGQVHYEGFFLLSILNFLALAYENDRGPVVFEEICDKINIPPGKTRQFLDQLIECHLVTESKTGLFILNQAPDHMNLWDIFSRLKINYFDVPQSLPENEFASHLMEIQKSIGDAYFNQLTRITLKTVLKKSTTAKIIPGPGVVAPRPPAVS